MQCSLQLKEVREYGFVEPQVVVASPSWSVAECDSKLLVIRHSSVRLNLEDLKCFEVVEHQFRQYGVTFKNAIALQPSNPAYPPRSGTTVLMAAPKSGWLEVIFSQTISRFCCYVTSSQRLILSAYDPHNLLISKLTSEPNLAGSDSPLPPNVELRLDKPNISRITFYAFDGQLTLTDLSFGF
ncbi:MAG TPA: hypothetical protein DCL61_28200 [Cyanobacteria bacterium UBA12227]|nr:hypothetical protein [Cyanobacteria bacterium UBA12227]HAX87786.1 hypothetical protein [Cyanobacteria bacterium UBA11370]HBY80202.1 hypothetical protein [Cyanobacteria bacterium UBA11148]